MESAIRKAPAQYHSRTKIVDGPTGRARGRRSREHRENGGGNHSTGTEWYARQCILIWNRLAPSVDACHLQARSKDRGKSHERADPRGYRGGQGGARASHTRSIPSRE